MYALKILRICSLARMSVPLLPPAAPSQREFGSQNYTLASHVSSLSVILSPRILNIYMIYNII